jgi:hypothetical protein
MLQSFYKYLVDELITDYFSTHKPEAGMKYYVLFEKQEHRDGLYDALSNASSSKPITVTGIFENRQEWMDVDVYETYCFRPNPDGVSIIVGNESETDNGYLTTLRNAVANSNSEYGQYALLNILCNNKLESITTAGINLLDVGGPLHQDVILKSVLDKLEHVAILDYDKRCLESYAESIKTRIEQNEADLFIFQDILSVLQNSTVSLTGKYHKFGYFPDRYCTEAGFIKIEEKEMAKRIGDNATHFERIKTILNSYSTEAFNELTKVYDNSLSNKIIKRPDDWFLIDYREIFDSVKKKVEQANYKFVSLQLSDNHRAELVCSALPSLSQKSKKVYVLVCDQTDNMSTKVKIDFNKPINDCCSIKEITYRDALKTQYSFSYNNSALNLELIDRPLKCEIGKDTNKFVFVFLRLKVAFGTFEFIKPYFSITSKANVSIKAPEDIDIITIGRGSKDIDFTDTLGDLEWKDDYKLKVDLNEYNEGVQLPIQFSDKKVVFSIEVDEKRIVPVKPPKITGEVWGGGKSATFPGGNKGRVGSNEYNIDGRFFGLIEIERRLASEKIYCLKKTTTSFSTDFEPVPLNLPSIVKERIDAIYDYYTRNQYAPSLAYIDDELYSLYHNYLEAIHTEIASIEQGKVLTEQQYSLTKLGTIEDGDRVLFTPYHPLLTAYMMEFKNRYKGDKFDNPKVLKLISPFYLMPYISYASINRQPYCDEFTQDIKTWLFYETANKDQQVRTYNITTKMVISKIQEFRKHFRYLFQVSDSPIIISTIGIYDDTNVVKGLFELVKSEMKTSSEVIQRIEVHEYVKNLSQETFFEKLNRLNSEELICKELDKVDTSLDMGNKDISPLQVIRQFFTRIDFYKHDIKACGNQIDYCHIAFYQMDTGLEFTKSPTSILRTELSLNGLISIPSTKNKDGKTYTVGFGTYGMPSDLYKFGEIYNIAIDMNSLYANEKNYWANSYSPNSCFAKTYVFNDDILLQSIYDKANWVTFINPEVDIDFFYRQKDLYVIHYTDQYTINAKYDSITVTRQTNQYDYMLSNYYDNSITNPSLKDKFRQTMMNYFNSLNGDWLLSLINKTDTQIREKMSIVSACIMMKKFLSRNENVTWIPISLEEILRVTGNIGLEQDSLFSKKALGVKGQLSDDLLMVGIEKEDDNIKLYFYPVEVKASTGTSFVNTASEQVLKTYDVLKDTLLVDGGFVNDVYRTFFASQILTNTDKLWANGLIPEEEYRFINSCRFNLLNMNYTISGEMKCKEMGYAATVSFVGNSAPDANLDLVNDKLPICHIYVSLDTCNACICNDDISSINQLLNSPILVSDAVRQFWKCQDHKTPNSMENTILKGDNEEHAVSSDIANNVATDNVISMDNVIDAEKEQNQTERMALSADTEEGYTFDSGIKITIGYSKVNHDPVVFEPNNTKLVSHPNMGIIGTMGTGKTQFARSVIAQFSKEGIHNVGGKPVGMLVFDYKGDYKDKEFLDSVGGNCYKFNYPFNPLKLVVNDEVEGMNLPAITADRISDSFAKAYGLGLKQQSNIKQVIIETYADAGITKDPETWNNPVPTMEQVIEKYFSTYDANDKAYALFDKLRDYTIFTTDNSNCVSLFEWLDSVRVIDLTLYPDDTKKVIVSLILDLFYAEMRQLGGSQQKNGFRELRAIIMVDEAHQFLKKDFNSFRSIISEGRMFGVGMILSTQNVSDFKSQKEDYSQFILSWMIHHVNSISRSEIASIFGASDSNAERYMDFINNAKLFESVCKIGSRVEGIRDLPFFELVKQDERFKPKELSLFD